MSAPPRGAGTEDSRRGGAFRAGFPALGPLPAALLFAGLAGGLLLVAADLSTVLEVSVGGSVVDRVRGADQHSWALVVLGVLALVLAVAAVARASRAAALALIGVGVVVLIVAFAGDLPDATRTGITRDFARASAAPSTGLYLELAGAVLLVSTGVSAVLAAPAWRAPATLRAGVSWPLAGGVGWANDRPNEEPTVEIPKDQILDFLRQHGQEDKASQADQELPDQVDTDKNADLLQKLGIDPGELLGGLGGKLPSGLGDKLGL